MILVTGATSLIGRAVVRRLAAGGREVRCLLRPSRREQQLPPGVPFSIVTAGLQDLPAMRTAMERVTAIIHLAGEEDLEQVGDLCYHVADTASLISAAQEVGVPRLVYLSCLGANRASAYPYLRAKGEVERMVRNSGLSYTIINAAITYGADDLLTNVWVMLAKMIPLLLPVPDTGLARFQPLWVEDLARCIVAALDEKRLEGQSVPIGGPEHFTIDQMAAEVLAAAGVRRKIVRVRMPFARWWVAVMDALLPRNPTPPWWLDVLSAGSAAELGNVARYCGFEPVRLSEGLAYLRQRRPWRRDFLRLVSHHYPRQEPGGPTPPPSD